MLRILTERHIRTLAHFAAARVLLAFDYDGTLAPIVPDPKAARMRASTRRLLASVARRYPCIVISGRARRDLVKRIGRIPVVHLSGNHGLEPSASGSVYPAQVRRWVRHLSARLRTHHGVVIEDKTFTASVHYRRARGRHDAVTAINAAVRDLRGVRVVGGKEVVNLVPHGAPTKGAALERARRRLGCDAAVYVGDDETDEDAFEAGPPERLLAIRIGIRRDSAATYGLRNQSEIDDLLRAFLAFRPVRRGDIA